MWGLCLCKWKRWDREVHMRKTCLQESKSSFKKNKCLQRHNCSQAGRGEGHTSPKLRLAAPCANPSASNRSRWNLNRLPDFSIWRWRLGLWIWGSHVVQVKKYQFVKSRTNHGQAPNSTPEMPKCPLLTNTCIGVSFHHMLARWHLPGREWEFSPPLTSGSIPAVCVCVWPCPPSGDPPHSASPGRCCRKWSLLSGGKQGGFWELNYQTGPKARPLCTVANGAQKGF